MVGRLNPKRWRTWPGAWLTPLLLALLLNASAAHADGEEPYPEFVADYAISVNGIKVGKARFRLEHLGTDEYLYESEATKTGLGRLLGSDKATERSRWRFVDGSIRALEYQARNPEGDDDDNAHLIFDWGARKVQNRGAGEHWRIAMPEGTLDQMVMQLAILLDLRSGERELRYPVATRGRIKQYRFEVVGEDRTELPFGDYRTLKLARTDDERDQSWIWSAPKLDYFPVRFLKRKESGLKTEILLQRLELSPGGAVAAE
jgi:hypothetical protein